MENIKDVIKDATYDTLADMKNNVGEIIKNEVLPGMTAAKDAFVTDLKADAAKSTSVWVKARSIIIIGVINFNCAIVNRVIDKLSAPAVDTAAPAVPVEPNTVQQ